eukprot:CAMPEP_0116021418 /NCGR_PEP_ID=MMETSP0321-20121206/10375_1 /TAXON_ID=163516 /ORGANISM="Leptocylindrus danicus var. danicus, Strain B650" /LENGTH=72 /DNA_ID=CAMNT_0003492285 /DNA_START=343 /DNA_END=561 /DNA_ORIENTATION=+
MVNWGHAGDPLSLWRENVKDWSSFKGKVRLSITQIGSNMPEWMLYWLGRGGTQKAYQHTRGKKAVIRRLFDV